MLRRPVPQLPRPGRRRTGDTRLHGACARGHERRSHERDPVARLRRDAGHRQGRRALHAARLLLQDIHPPSAPLAALREGAARRRRPRATAQVPARARVAHRLSPPPRRRARGRRGRGRSLCRDRRRRARRRRGALRRGRRARRAPARRGRPRPRARAGGARPGGRRRGARTRPRWERSTASSRSGRATRFTRSAPSATSMPPAPSSSRCCSPATTCPGSCSRAAPAGWPRSTRCGPAAAPWWRPSATAVWRRRSR